MMHMSLRKRLIYEEGHILELFGQRGKKKADMEGKGFILQGDLNSGLGNKIIPIEGNKMKMEN